MNKKILYVGVGCILSTLVMASTLSQTVKIITGEQLIHENTTNSLNYINGVLDGSNVSGFLEQFSCKKLFLPDDPMVSNKILLEIKSNPDLQNQSGPFAVMNSYRKLYCK